MVSPQVPTLEVKRRADRQELSTAVKEAYLAGLSSRLSDPKRLEESWSVTFLARTNHDKLDSIVHTATMLLRAPMGNISIITDQMIVVAGVGIGDQLTFSAEQTHCQHVIDGRPFEVTDATVNQLVCLTQPVINGVLASYLGVPVIVGNQVVGSLCVFDTEPRDWTRADVRMLTALALTVQEVLT